jgi:pyruvate dehydrogenase E2 component (dihydrolipoamide acetyltransferase)
MDILMPQLGETVAEGKITKWFKSAGDAVKPGDNLFEIETDKVSMEVPSTTAGVLSEIRVGAGEVAPVGAVVGIIADDIGAVANAPADALPSPSAAKLAPASFSEPPILDKQPDIASPSLEASPVATHINFTPGAEAASPKASIAPRPIKLDPFFEVRTPERNYGPAKLAGGISVTPLARRLAGEAGINLSRIRGSGPHGRIVARDVEQLPRPSPALVAPAQGPSAAEIKALYAPGSYEEVPLDAMRRTIAARLTAAATVPHFCLMTDVVIDRLISLREEANGAAPKDKDGNAAFKLSLNDFVIRALALALQRVPAANAIWAGDRILRFKHSDVGVAVALEGGLITPLIRNAETKSLSAISVEMTDLSARARSRKLQPAEYQGGASAISNLGMHNVREFTAIINPPHATILAVGAARRQAVERNDGGVAFASMLSVTLSCDHRVLDGALGAELLAAIKTLLESPVSLLV